MVPDGSNNVGSGNTKQTPKDKRISPAVHWFFTFNNYSEDDIKLMVPIFKEKCSKYCFQEETGKEGTKHLQGIISLKEKNRPFSLNLPKEIHWEGVKDITAAYKYCSKEDTRSGLLYTYNYEPVIPEKLDIIENLRDWQKDVIDNVICTKPDGRSIYWYYDEIGGCGKSSFCKYAYVKHNCLVIQGGKLADIMNIIFNANMSKHKCVIIDIPRTNKNKVSYASIECILNGMITNTKFETGIKVFNPPHVIVFSNFYPDKNKLSLDRWKIKDINPIEFIDDTLE